MNVISEESIAHEDATMHSSEGEPMKSKSKLISGALIQFIRIEFAHIDWECPMKSIPPPRAVDWANFVGASSKPNSSILIRLIQHEFTHIDWNRPERFPPPRRVLDWTYVDDVPKQLQPSHWLPRSDDPSVPSDETKTAMDCSRGIHHKARMRYFSRAQQARRISEEHYEKCIEKHETMSYCAPSLPSVSKSATTAKKDTKFLDSIDKEIEMLEEEIHMLEEDVKKQKVVSKLLIHLIQQEFSHVDWNCPLPVGPHRRVMDWSPEFPWTPGIDRTNLVEVKRDPIIVRRLNARLMAAKSPEEKCIAHLQYCQDVIQCYYPDDETKVSET